MEENLRDIKRGRLAVPDNVDLVTFHLSDGHVPETPSGSTCSTRTSSRCPTSGNIPGTLLGIWRSTLFHWQAWTPISPRISGGAQQVSRDNPEWRREFQETLPDLREEDIAGSGFGITDYTVHQNLGGDAALARLRERLRKRGLKLMLDFVPDHMGLGHPWVEDHPDYFVPGVVGKPGTPSIGIYEPLLLNNPTGWAVDSQGQLCVAEAENFPRRVSLWSADGKLVWAFYGPTEYGGGGVLDPRDQTRFFYKGMEFKLDWQTGSDQLVRVFARPNHLLEAHYGHYSPDTPLYPPAQKGHRYFTSCYTHNPTSGDDIASVWQDGSEQARLVAAFGHAHFWPVLRAAEFRSRWPEGSKPGDDNPKSEALETFAWTDANGDGKPQPAEGEFVSNRCRGVTVMNDLSVVVSQFADMNVRLAAIFDAAGFPHYDLAKPEDLGPPGGRQPSSGGNQPLTDAGGWTINTNASEPFSPYSLGGKFRGEPRWSYPSPWPGLHASHEAAVPEIGRAWSWGTRDCSAAGFRGKSVPCSASTAIWETCISSPPMDCSSARCSMTSVCGRTGPRRWPLATWM